MAKISLRKTEEGTVEILEDGVRVSTAAADQAETLARARGGEFLGFEGATLEKLAQDVPTGASVPPITGTTSALRKEMAEADITVDDAVKKDTVEEFEIFKKEAEAKLDVGEFPSRPSGTRVEQFEILREEQGIVGIESRVIDLEAQREEEFAKIRAFRAEELTGPGTLAFARGRIGAEERAVQERVDFINRQLTVANNRLKVKNQNIRTIMDLTDADFDDAKEEYEFEFERNLAIVDAFEEFQDEKQREREKSLAHDKATYTTMTNLVKDVPFDDIPDNFFNRIAILEATLGFPEGSLKAVKSVAPNTKTIKHGTSFDESGNQFAWFIQEDKDGIPTVVSIPTGGVRKGAGVDIDEFSAAEDFVRAFPDATDEELTASLSRDSTLSPTDIRVIIANRPEKITLDDEELKNLAVLAVEGSFEKKLKFSRETELQNTKDFIKKNLDGILKDLGKTKITEEDKKAFLLKIDTITFDDIKI